MKHYNLKFDSLTALSRFIKETPVKGVFKEFEVLSSTRKSRETTEFTKTSNFEEAEKLLTRGYLDGAKRVQAYMLKTAGNGIKNTLYNDFVGFAPNVPNYIAGIPTNMLNVKKSKAKKNIIRLFYNVAVGCDVTAEQIEQAAASLFNVIVGIEKRGCRVELWCGDLSKTDTEQINIVVCVKQANIPLNVNAVAYAVVHPSFARRHCFAVSERAGATSKKWTGYGRAITQLSEQKEALEQLHIGDAVMFNYYQIRNKNEAEIANEIQHQIKQLGK